MEAVGDGALLPQPGVTPTLAVTIGTAKNEEFHHPKSMESTAMVIPSLPCDYTSYTLEESYVLGEMIVGAARFSRKSTRMASVDPFRPQRVPA